MDRPTWQRAPQPQHDLAGDVGDRLVRRPSCALTLGVVNSTLRKGKPSA